MESGDVEAVLDRYRDAVERPQSAALGNRRVGGCGVLQRRLTPQLDDRVHHRVYVVDPGEQNLGQLARRDLAASQHARRIACRAKQCLPNFQLLSSCAKSSRAAADLYRLAPASRTPAMPLTTSAESRPSGMNTRPGFPTSASGDRAPATADASAAFERRRGSSPVRSPARPREPTMSPSPTPCTGPPVTNISR